MIYVPEVFDTVGPPFSDAYISPLPVAALAGNAIADISIIAERTPVNNLFSFTVLNLLV